MSDERDLPNDELEAAAAEPGMGGAGTPTETLLRIREVLGGIFERMGAQVDVDVRDTAEAIHCDLRFRSGAEILDAAPRGQVLEAAQYLLGRIVNREAEGRKRIVLGLEGAPSRTDDPAMAEMARRLARSVRAMGKSLTVVPMNSKDRKAIHVALEGVEGVRTRSEGDGNLRRLVIEGAPREPAPAGDSPE